MRSARSGHASVLYPCQQVEGPSGINVRLLCVRYDTGERAKESKAQENPPCCVVYCSPFVTRTRQWMILWSQPGALGSVVNVVIATGLLTE